MAQLLRVTLGSAARRLVRRLGPVSKTAILLHYSSRTKVTSMVVRYCDTFPFATMAFCSIT